MVDPCCNMVWIGNELVLYDFNGYEYWILISYIDIENEYWNWIWNLIWFW